MPLQSLSSTPLPSHWLTGLRGTSQHRIAVGNCFFVLFSFSVFNGRLLLFKMDNYKREPTARESRRNARRREIRKEDKAKVQGEPSSRPRCLDALRSPDNCESTRRKKTAKSLATKTPRMNNPDNCVSSLSADVFSTALDSDINQLNDRFCCQHHVSRDETEKRHEMKNKALYLTRGQLPAGHTKGTNYFTGCRPVETKPVQCTNTN